MIHKSLTEPEKLIGLVSVLSNCTSKFLEMLPKCVKKKVISYFEADKNNFFV